MRLHWSTRKVRQTQPYEKLAPLYDHIMRHVDYDRWADYVDELIQRWRPGAVTILDIACGTGNLLAKLQRDSFYVGGCDFSLPMIQQAKQKKTLQSLPIWCGNMVDLPVKSPADVLLCLYDSINYLMDLDDVYKFFSSAAQALVPNGLLIFDVCTERNSLDFFYNYYDHEKQAAFSYDRWSHYDRKTRIQYTEFKMRFKSDPLTYWEIHQQRIYPVVSILQMIKASPLRLLEQYDGFSFQCPTVRSNRIHFVLERKE